MRISATGRSGRAKTSSGSSRLDRTTPLPVGEGWIIFEGERIEVERGGEEMFLLVRSVAGIEPRSLTAENKDTPPDN